MPKYNVGWTYTLWTIEDAEDEEAAIRQSCETDHKVSCGPTAKLEINEHDDPIVNQDGFDAEELNRTAREFFKALEDFGNLTGVDTEALITRVNDDIESILDKAQGESND